MRILVVVLITSFALRTLVAQDDFLKERSEGFLQLFDGVTLQGWLVNGEGRWRPVDSMLVSETPASPLRTEHASFTDYILRCEWRAAAGASGALLLRGEEYPSASLQLESSGGDWRKLEVVVERGAVQERIDGSLVRPKASWPGLPARGAIAFVNRGVFTVRAVRVRPLGLDVPYFVKNVQTSYKLQCVGCHGGGAARGKFPMQIPNLGIYDDAQTLQDYLESAKRVTAGKPDESLLLNKPLGLVTHGGGKQFAPDSSDAKAFAAWIRGATLTPQS